ncbi:MAG: LysR family transcriptional regulator [Oscillospiraceae bacterium]
MIDAKLVTLLKVNELHNFTRAAEQLSLTQPAVSQHIRQLERELGVKLFNRSDSELKLTAEGETVVLYAKRICSLYENLTEKLSDEKKSATKLTVGITHTAESNIVAEVLAKYCRENDGLCIKIITDSINNLYDKLNSYELDLAIVEGPVTDAKYNSLLLDTDSLVLAVSNNNPLAKKSMVTINEIKKERMILRLPNSGTRNLFMAHIESRNMTMDEFNIIMEVDNIATIKDLIRRDFGVSILAKSACLDELKKKKITVLPVENLSMIREINVVYHRDFEHIEILRDFTKMYNDTMKLYR